MRFGFSEIERMTLPRSGGWGFVRCVDDFEVGFLRGVDDFEAGFVRGVDDVEAGFGRGVDDFEVGFGRAFEVGVGRCTDDFGIGFVEHGSLMTYAAATTMLMLGKTMTMAVWLDQK